MSIESRVFDILIIEDNPAEAMLMREAWQECKIVQSRVSVLSESKDAIVYLRGAPPYQSSPIIDLVLLDYKMPVDGGIALTEIKGDPAYMHLPVIVFSGSVDPADYLEAYQRHANCCFRKPSSLDEYLNLVCFIAEAWLVRAVLPRR